MLYNIESRQLTSEATRAPHNSDAPNQMTIDADDVEGAITFFLQEQQSELVSGLQQLPGRESIATVRKDDSVYLVRISAA